MPKQLLLLFAIAALLFACNQPETGENKYTKHEWDSISKAKHELEFDSVLTLYKKSHMDLYIPGTYLEDKKGGEKKPQYQKYYPISKTTYFQFDSLTIEEWSIYHLCYPTRLLYIYNKNFKTIFYLERANRYEPNKYFKDEFNLLLSKIKLPHNKYEQDVPFISKFMKTYYYADRLYESNEVSTIKSQYPKQKECVDSVNVNSGIIAKKLTLPPTNELLIYKSDVFYYVFTVKYTDGYYSIINQEILPSACLRYFCI
jgi:hypothetical protein